MKAIREDSYDARYNWWRHNLKETTRRFRIRPRSLHTDRHTCRRGTSPDHL